MKYCDVFNIFRQVGNGLVLLAQLTAEVSGLVNQIYNNILSTNTRRIQKGSGHTVITVYQKKLDHQTGLFSQAYFVLFNLLLQAFYDFIGRGYILFKIDKFGHLRIKIKN